MYLKLKYGDFLLIDIVYENGPIKFFCISAVLMLDVSIDTGLRTFLHLISIYKYDIFVVFGVFDSQDRQGNFSPQKIRRSFRFARRIIRTLYHCGAYPGLKMAKRQKDTKLLHTCTS